MISLSLSLALSLSLSSLSVSLCFSLSLYLCIYPSIYSIYLSIHPSIHLSLSLCLSLSLSLPFSGSLFVFLPFSSIRRVILKKRDHVLGTVGRKVREQGRVTTGSGRMKCRNRWASGSKVQCLGCTGGI